MIRLYYDGELEVGGRVSLQDSELRYFRSVRRAQGDPVLFNRKGVLARGQLQGGEFSVESIEIQPNREFPISLGLAMTEPKTLSEIIPSVSELGIEKLYLFYAQRSQAGSRRSVDRKERWDRVCIESSRQCGRHQILELEEISFEELIQRPGFSSRVVMSESEFATQQNEGASLLRAPCLYLVGPEGGWTAEEFSALRRENFSFCHVDAPVFRVSTAVQIGFALIMTQLFPNRVNWCGGPALRVDPTDVAS
jgi:16S rRNA (uracil1498-N3)-methyltransferase